MRRFAIRVLAVAAALVALSPSVASAQVPQPWIDRAQIIAMTVWGNPCGDFAVIEFAPAAIGDSGWTYGDCRIFFRSGKLYGWPEFCSTLIHEYGHIAGYRDPDTGDFHSSNPRSVMYAAQAIITVRGDRGGLNVDGADRRCYDRGRRYLGMASARMGWR